MTRQRSFKRLVRARMEKTGESYTAARASLLGGEEAEAGAAAQPVLATTDERIRQRTGRGWEEWFDRLDEWGAPKLEHREIARRVAEELGIEPLGWAAQAVTVSYERARRGREVGERSDGFAVSASKTVAVPVGRLFDAVVDDGERALWLPGYELRERTSTRPRSARFDWGEAGTRVHATFVAKDEDRSTVTLEHRRLGDAEEAERMKAFWRERVAALKEVLER